MKIIKIRIEKFMATFLLSFLQKLFKTKQEKHKTYLWETCRKAVISVG